MTYTERLQLEVYYREGFSRRKMAERLNKSIRTIYYELKSGKTQILDWRTYDMKDTYSAAIADRAAKWKASGKGRPIKLDNNYIFESTLTTLLHEKRSPYHISDYCKVNGIADISPSTIYRYIDRGYIAGITKKDLPEWLKRKRTYHKVKRMKRPPVGMSIERRPDISNRQEFGHWEIDTIYGKQKGKGQAALVLTERKTRYELIYKLKARDVESVNRRVKQVLRQLKGKVPFRSFTVDNGSEFNGLIHIPDLPVYYCHPYCSSERGSNERNNREIRRHIPKGKSLKSITQTTFNEIAHWMNTMYRPRSISTTSERAFCAELQICQESAI